MSCRMQTSAMRSSSDSGVTAPDGLPGELRRTAFVRGVIAASISSAFSRIWCSGLSATGTGAPPHIRTSASYEVKYGDGRITSSPASSSAFIARNRPMVAPSTACISVSMS